MGDKSEVSALQKIMCPSALALSNMYQNLGGLRPQLKNLNSREIYFQLKFFMLMLQMFQQ